MTRPSPTTLCIDPGSLITGYSLWADRTPLEAGRFKARAKAAPLARIRETAVELLTLIQSASTIEIIVIEVPTPFVSAFGSARDSHRNVCGAGSPERPPPPEHGGTPMPSTAEQPAILMIDVECLIPTPDNPRRIRVNDPAVRELAENIRSVGVIQPVVARPIPAGTLPGTHWPEWSVTHYARGRDCYDLRAGHRRLLASMQAGLKTIPTIVRELDDKAAMEITVAENMQREDLSPVEEAAGVQHMLDVGWDMQAIADRIGKTPAWVARRARLHQLSETWRGSIDQGEDAAHWPATLLERVARLEPASQDALYAIYQRHRRYSDPGTAYVPSLAELDGMIQAQVLRSLNGAPWKLDDDTLLPAVGSCTACQKRSACQPLLFDDPEEIGPKKRKQQKTPDRCLDDACYQRKADAHIARLIAEFKASQAAPVAVADGGYTDKQIKAMSHGLPVVREWDLVSARNGQTGALPVIHVNGPRRGHVTWHKPRYADSKVAKHAAKAGKSVRAEVPVTPLKERRKMLQRRRMAHVLDAVRDVVHKIAKGKRDVPNHLTWKHAATLALAFGTSHRAGFGDDLKPWKGVAREPEWTVSNTLALVRAVLPVLHSRMMYHNGQEAEARYNEARQTAVLLRLDLQALEAAAVAAIPEPKAWAGLKTDGKPKAAAKRTKKQAAKPTATVATTPAKARPKASTPAAKKRTSHKRTKTKAGTCRVCGCTDEHACPGGCYWVEPDLCSACAEADSVAADE